MNIDTIFHDASRIMTVISFATFMGIVLWTYALNKERDFAGAAAMPFADDAADDADGLEEDYV